jgi:glycosyltransferase involved in cell wall biosynthesis
MKKALEEKGFANVFVMPNCKELNVLTEEELVYSKAEPFKLCTFSRVCKQKGIEDAVKAVIEANEHFGRTVYTLDIYGQVDSNEIEWFANLKTTFPEYVQYGGLVPFDKSVEVLKDYYALLFPTYYEGEGFAGTILDAYAAGIPVIASDWKYNAEIVKVGETGFLHEAKNAKELTQLLLEMFEKNLILVKKNCLKEAKKYSPEIVIGEFVARLD